MNSGLWFILGLIALALVVEWISYSITRNERKARRERWQTYDNLNN